MELETNKWIDVMGFLYENPIPSLRTVSKTLDITYAHVLKIVMILQDKKLVITRKRGRIREVKLTRKGKEIAVSCKKIVTYTKNAMQT